MPPFVRTTVAGGMLIGAFLGAAVTPTSAAGLSIEDVKLYLIWEDSGGLSPDVSGEADQLVANGEDGTSIQMVVDVILAGPPNSLHEDVPRLVFSARDPYSQTSLYEAAWPISYIAHTGRIVRSAIVDHNCNPVDLVVSLEENGATVDSWQRSVSITCGD